MVTKPKKYDMSKPEDIKRWFKEMEGYLKTEDFVKQGTDFDGRCFAMDGFRQLRIMMYKQINSSTLTKLGELNCCFNSLSGTISRNNEHPIQ